MPSETSGAARERGIPPHCREEVCAKCGQPAVQKYAEPCQPGRHPMTWYLCRFHYGQEIGAEPAEIHTPRELSSRWLSQAGELERHAGFSSRTDKQEAMRREAELLRSCAAALDVLPSPSPAAEGERELELKELPDKPGVWFNAGDGYLICQYKGSIGGYSLSESGSGAKWQWESQLPRGGWREAVPEQPTADARRAAIAERIPSDEDLALVAIDPPREWLDDKWDVRPAVPAQREFATLPPPPEPSSENDPWYVKSIRELVSEHRKQAAELAAARKEAETNKAAHGSLRDMLDNLGEQAEKIYDAGDYRWAFGEALAHLVEDAAKWKAELAVAQQEIEGLKADQDHYRQLVAMMNRMEADLGEHWNRMSGSRHLNLLVSVEQLVEKLSDCKRRLAGRDGSQSTN